MSTEKFSAFLLQSIGGFEGKVSIANVYFSTSCLENGAIFSDRRPGECLLVRISFFFLFTQVK